MYSTLFYLCVKSIVRFEANKYLLHYLFFIGGISALIYHCPTAWFNDKINMA